MKIIKPERLRKNDLIGIIAPASNVDDAGIIKQGVRYFEKEGYRVIPGNNLEKLVGYLAGTDQQRVDDLHAMFENKKVKAIFCLRGGYGAFRLLDKINYKLIRNNPKIFVGYSEITALQMAMFTKCGLVTFAGPMVAPDFSNQINSVTEEYFWKLITSPQKMGNIDFKERQSLPQVVKGKSSGRIIGGNLAVVSAMFGTEYFPKVNKRILFLEEISEPPYKIDRMLNLLRLHGLFTKLNGIILGSFVNCEETDNAKKTFTLGEVIIDYMEKLKIPVLYNFPHGHIKEKITIPFGINININAYKGTIEYTESAVT